MAEYEKRVRSIVNYSAIENRVPVTFDPKVTGTRKAAPVIPTPSSLPSSS